LDSTVYGMSGLSAEVKAARRAKAKAFGERVDTWLKPPTKMDSELSDELASVMGKDLYAVYARQLQVEAVKRPADPESMAPQAVFLRQNNGKMLVRVSVSSTYGSKWTGDVICDIQDDADKFIARCEEESALALKSYTISFNGRLLTGENVLHNVGVRDGKQVFLLPMGKGLNYRPNWSVRQTDAVVAKMEERDKKLKLSGSTQNLMRESLGRDLYNTLDTSFAIVDKNAVDPDEDEKTRRARELKEKKMADAEFVRTDLYDKTWGERPKAMYKKRTLRPLAGFCTDQAKIARASRPLQNYEVSMKESTSKALQGKPDSSVPHVDTLAQWFNTYGESNNFFKGTVQPGEKDCRQTMYGFVDKKAQGTMSSFERSRRSYGKVRSQAVSLRKGNLAA